MNNLHKHHIIPKHEWKRRFGSLSGVNSPDNLVHLTTEQHANVHKLLYELNGSKYDLIAHEVLSGQIGHEEAIIEAGREANLGKKKSEEFKRKQSQRMIGRKISLGRRLSPQGIENHRKRMQGNSYSKKYNYIVSTPEGKDVLITGNMSKFCQFHGLSHGTMLEVAKGNRKHHHNYKCKIVEEGNV